MIRNHELAAILIAKAEEDAWVINNLLKESDAPESIIGFHAQQAIEKFLKAVLTYHDIHYRRTHDLLELIDLLLENKIAFPKELENIQQLTPYAVEFRYISLLPEEKSLLTPQQCQKYVFSIKEWVYDELNYRKS